jgi:hypothetical protein
VINEDCKVSGRLIDINAGVERRRSVHNGGTEIGIARRTPKGMRSVLRIEQELVIGINSKKEGRIERREG